MSSVVAHPRAARHVQLHRLSGSAIARLVHGLACHAQIVCRETRLMSALLPIRIAPHHSHSQSLPRPFGGLLGGLCRLALLPGGAYLINIQRLTRARRRGSAPTSKTCAQKQVARSARDSETISRQKSAESAPGAPGALQSSGSARAFQQEQPTRDGVGAPTGQRAAHSGTRDTTLGIPKSIVVKQRRQRNRRATRHSQVNAGPARPPL